MTHFKLLLNLSKHHASMWLKASDLSEILEYGDAKSDPPKLTSEVMQRKNRNSAFSDANLCRHKRHCTMMQSSSAPKDN